MNVFAALRERTRLMIGATIVAFALLACGALMIFVLSPQQELLAQQIKRMRNVDATAVQAARPGKELLVTGFLEGNAILDEGIFVAYTVQEWVVTPPVPDDDDEAKGSWKTAERIIPTLTLNVQGQPVRILRADNVHMSGPLHEKVIRSDRWLQAEYNGRWLPEGSLRKQGLLNGDLVTVLGKKASSEGIIPSELYAGDRVAFADSKHRAARGLLVGGTCLIGLAPAVLLGGVLIALRMQFIRFGHRRRFR